MGKPIYLADPAVAAHYHVHPGEWAWIADNEEADWLLAQGHGYGIDNRKPVPSAYYVHPDAPLPFVPYAAPAPAPTPPAPVPSPEPAPAPEPPAPAPAPAPDPSAT